MEKQVWTPTASGVSAKLRPSATPPPLATRPTLEPTSADLSLSLGLIGPTQGSLSLLTTIRTGREPSRPASRTCTALPRPFVSTWPSSPRIATATAWSAVSTWSGPTNWVAPVAKEPSPGKTSSGPSTRSVLPASPSTDRLQRRRNTGLQGLRPRPHDGRLRM